MFVIVQFPFADLRPLVNGERGRLQVPDWAADEPKGFVRGFGKISPRNSSSLGLLGESRFADMTNAIRFPDHIQYAEIDWPCALDIIPWFRRLYFDGQIAGRFELGFLISDYYEDIVFDRKDEPVTPIDPTLLAQQVLSTSVQINSVDGSKQIRPLARCGKELGRAFLTATTSNAGLKSNPIADTLDSVFFVGDPFVTLRIASGRPISDGRDRRNLNSHNEPALFITSASGSNVRNNVIVQASIHSARDETGHERVTRVLFAHLNSLIFAFARLQELGPAFAGKSNRIILQKAVKTMIDRLERFKQSDVEEHDAIFTEGLQSFAKAYAGRIDELSSKLEALSIEWNKPTRLERFGQYFSRVHDLIIKTSVEKTIDIGLKGGV